MSQVTRRHAFKVLAAGAVLTSGASAVVTDDIGPASGEETAPALLPAGAFAASSSAAQRNSIALPLHEATSVAEASVAHCRSWDSAVYLYVDDAIKGFVQVNPPGFALAAVCQASGRKIAIRYWGYDPSWNNGAGRFEGALLALDPRDLPTHPWVASMRS